MLLKKKSDKNLDSLVKNNKKMKKIYVIADFDWTPDLKITEDIHGEHTNNENFLFTWITLAKVQKWDAKKLLWLLEFEEGSLYQMYIRGKPSTD